MRELGTQVTLLLVSLIPIVLISFEQERGLGRHKIRIFVKSCLSSAQTILVLESVNFEMVLAMANKLHTVGSKMILRKSSYATTSTKTTSSFQ